MPVYTSLSSTLPAPAFLCLLKPFATRVVGEAWRQVDTSQGDPPSLLPCLCPFKSLLISWSPKQHKLLHLGPQHMHSEGGLLGIEDMSASVRVAL